MAAQVGPATGDSGAGIQYPPSLSGFQKWLDWVSGNPDPGTLPGPEDTGAANATGDYPNPYPPTPTSPPSSCDIPLVGGLVCGAQKQANKDLLILGGVLIVAVVIFK